MRLLASMARVDAHKFRTGHLSREDWRGMAQTLGQLSQAPLWIDDSGSATVTEIGAKARRLKRDRGLSLVIIDYLQLIAASGRFSNRNEEVSSITRGLKGLAKELKVPVLVLSQLTRARNARNAARNWRTCANRAPSSRTPTWCCLSTVRTYSRKKAK